MIVSLKEKGCPAYWEPDYDPADDPLLPKAREEVVRTGKASASLLQRRLLVGYARAASLLDSLEEEGLIGEADGAKPRKVLFDGQLKQ